MAVHFEFHKVARLEVLLTFNRKLSCFIMFSYAEVISIICCFCVTQLFDAVHAETRTVM